MTVKIFELVDGEFQLKSTPKVLVREQEGATFIFNVEQDKNLTLWITPSLIL